MWAKHCAQPYCLRPPHHAHAGSRSVAASLDWKWMREALRHKQLDWPYPLVGWLPTSEKNRTLISYLNNWTDCIGHKLTHIMSPGENISGQNLSQAKMSRRSKCRPVQINPLSYTVLIRPIANNTSRCKTVNKVLLWRCAISMQLEYAIPLKKTGPLFHFQIIPTNLEQHFS